jgi:hypothetical protein
MEALIYLAVPVMLGLMGLRIIKEENRYRK